MIPQNTVQQILDTAQIAEVVGDFVSLKKRGASLMACCPFHNEKTPSFHVSPAKGIYKCFGCGKGGDSVKFVMELEGLSYPESLRWLAKKYNIEVVEREQTDQDLIQQNEKESLFIALEYSQNYFQSQLNNSEEGQSIGQSYFIERGFSKDILTKFNLGYALDQRDQFTNQALKDGFSLEILDKAGLVSIKDDGNRLDRFRGRVIFPIHNLAGKPIAFGARILKNDPKAPKYINSPETEIYHKSKIVYGIYQAKNEIRQADNCFLVEGYTDVISLHQAGIENVVASSGTSLTPEQVRLIRRFSENITVLYDGDSAGIKASLRGIDIILEENMNVKSVVFPDGDDPDSYMRKIGSEAFKKYILENQKDFIRFKTELSLEETGNDPIKKAALITDLVNTITKIPNAIKRALFYKEVSTLLQIDEVILVNEGNKTANKKQRNESLEVIPLPTNEIYKIEETYEAVAHNSHEEIVVRDLVLFGGEIIDIDESTGINRSLADYLIEESENFEINTPVYRKIFDLYVSYHKNNQTPNIQVFTSNTDFEIQEKVIDWLSPKHEISARWEQFEVYIPKYKDILSTVSYKNILKATKDKMQDEVQTLLNDLEDASLENEEIILVEVAKKKETIQLIAEELGMII